jgi:hypothetical protein
MLRKPPLKIGLERQGKQEQKFDAAFGTMVRVVNVFKEACRSVILYIKFYLLTRQNKN